MNRNWHRLIALAVGLLALTGCASSKPHTTKTYERPWIGGAFESVELPKAARARGDGLFRSGVLVTEAPAETPINRAGLQPADLILSANGRRVRNADQLGSAISRSPGPITLSVYRSGEISEKQVQPGVERFQTTHHLSLAIGVSKSYTFDLIPNPDFSLIALGFKNDKKRLDLHSAKGRHLSHLQSTRKKSDSGDSDEGIQSVEGWRAWIGPISLGENKLVVSQNASPTK